MNTALICIGGLLGVGKTTVAYELSCVLPNSVVICPDRLRLRLLGKNPKFDVLRDEDITRETTHQVIELMQKESRDYLLTGKTVIIGSAFVLSSMRESYEQMANELGATFRGFWLEADEFIQMERVRNRRKGLPQNGNVSAVSELQAMTVTVEGDVFWHRVDASVEVEEVVKTVFGQLNL